jgi:hypothetical protein
MHGTHRLVGVSIERSDRLSGRVVVVSALYKFYTEAGGWGRAGPRGKIGSTQSHTAPNPHLTLTLHSPSFSHPLRPSRSTLHIGSQPV